MRENLGVIVNFILSNIYYLCSETIFTLKQYKEVNQTRDLLEALTNARHIFFSCLISCYFMMSDVLVWAQDTGDDEQVKIQADKLFAEKKYAEAFPLYSQLLSIHRKDPYFSYRFGVCLLYTDRRDPEEPLRYIEPSVGELTGEDTVMIYFHLGVAYHQAYRFGEALRAFEAFKGKISTKSPYVKEAFIRNQMCNNGITLLQNLSDLIVMKKYEVNLDNFFRSYDISKFGGSIGPKPEFLKSKPDKESLEPEMIFFSDTHSVVYYSSYGKKNVTGRDIYRIYKLPDGKFSTPEKLSSAINTPYDENYPYLLPDGKTLYFSSKGHNSIGGYDIFRTEFDSAKGDWITPVNVDFAINTPFDDILFITDPDQKYAWFSSFRNSTDGRVMVFLVRIDSKMQVSDDFNPKMIAAENIDVKGEEYLQTIAKLREKAKLEVNSNEEIVIDSTKAIAAKDNARYNIPENPTGQQIVDIAFQYVNEAENQMDNFRNMRNGSIKVSEQKKDQAAALNKQSQDLYEKALVETDSKKRKDMMAQSSELSKQSLLLTDEANLSKQMYDQYVVASDGQNLNLNSLQEKAGYVQQMALSRQIDTSVVLLKELIDEVDTFKINLVQLDKKIRGDDEYVVELEKNITDNLNKSTILEVEAKALDKDAELFAQEAALASDPELKQEYIDEATNIRAKASEKRTESLQLQTEAKQQQNDLVELKNKAALRSKIVSDAIAYNNAQNNVADNNQNITDNNIQNIADNNNQHVSDNNNQNTDDNNNQSDSGNVVIGTDRKEVIKNQVLQDIALGSDSVKQLLNRSSKQMDAVSLAFSKKKNEYDFKLSEWQKLRSKADLTQSEQIMKSELETDMSNLNLQMNVLSDYHGELHKENIKLVQATSNFENLTQELKQDEPSDTIAWQKLQSMSAEILGMVHPDEDNSHNILTIQTNDIKSAIKTSEDLRDKARDEQKVLQKNLSEQESKLESTSNPKKRTQLEKNIVVTREKLGAMDNKVDEMNTQIIKLNDSIGYLTKRYELLGEVRSSYIMIPDSELKTMSESWEATSVKPDINYVSTLPDFAASNQTNHVSDNHQNIIDNNNQNITDNNNVPTTETLIVGDEEQDLIQSSFYEKGAETFMVRIANLNKKLVSHPTDSNQIKSEIALLRQTMKAYNSEAEAYRNNAENNFRLIGKSLPEQIPAFSQQSVTEFHQQQYELEMHKADSVRKLADATTDPAIKNKLEKQASDFQESAKRHYLMASDIYGVWNNSEYENNNVVLTESNIPTNSELDSSHRLILEARRLRSEAFRTSSFDKQKELLTQAQEKEKQALTLQQKTITANAIENPERIVSKIISEIESSTGTEMRELAKIYPTNDDLLVGYTRSTIDNTQNIANNNPIENTNQVSNISQISDTNQVTDNNQITHNNQVTDNNQTSDNNQVSENPQITNNIQISNNQATDHQTSSVARLYYRVQIAASRVEVDTTKYFNGLNVVIDTIGLWRQYLTGYFTSYNPAVAECKRVKPLGYVDAFVVAYYDGKRVPVYEARQIEQGRTIAGTTVPTGNLSMTDVEGLVYSVQVGVYAKTRNSNSLFGINPLIEECMANGYYRYYAGVFNTMNDAIVARNKIRISGVPDAFIVILYKGKKITQAEANKLIADGVTFGGEIKSTNTATQPQNHDVIHVNTSPAVKPVYKVQIGAYSKDVPVFIVNTLIEIAGQGIETTKNEAGLTVYSVGSFAKYSDAEKKKIELNSKGLPDAFVIAYTNGKQILITDAKKLSGE